MKLLLSSATLSLLAVTSMAQERELGKRKFCKDVPITFVSATSPDADGLEESFELFCDLLGGDNNMNNVKKNGIKDGHHQINWDGENVPFDMPGDFFAIDVTRGCTIRSDSNEFRVSNPMDGSDDLFDSINRGAAKDFQTFSAKRLFTSVKENEFTIDFSQPGFVNPATVEGFGAVFVDVKEDHKTKMTFYAESGCIIAEEYVKPSAEGLSFLGAFSGSSKFPIFKVEVVLGEEAIDHGDSKHDDIVVMDDFLYSEPQALKWHGKSSKSSKSSKGHQSKHY